MQLVDPGPGGIITTTATFAQVAIGGGFTTVFTMINTGSDPVTGDLVLTGDDGQPLDATLSSTALAEAGIGPVFASSAELNIPPAGTQIIKAEAPNASDPTTAGWARIESEGGSVSGVATFKLTQGGILTTVVGVLGAGAVSAATIPVDDDVPQDRFTGYAVANPGGDNINIKIVVVNTDGSIFQTLNPPELNPLGPGNHLARFLFQDLNDNSLKFQGSMVLIAQDAALFSIVALVQESGLFTAIPVIPTKAPNIN
jgi:hypothetical protein